MSVDIPSEWLPVLRERQEEMRRQVNGHLRELVPSLFDEVRLEWVGVEEPDAVADNGSDAPGTR